MQEPAPSRIAVVHIALASYGIQPFSAFVESYRKHKAGVPHDLIIVFKGFCDEAELVDYRAALGSLRYISKIASDSGFDIGTYLITAREIDHDYIFCLNSRSIILSHDWLKLMYVRMRAEGVGMVSATASLQSLYSDHVCIHRRTEEGRGWRGRLRKSWLNSLRHLIEFRPYPNPHLRTNAFMIGRTHLLELFRGSIVSRRDAARFENGRNSISARMMQRGFGLVVVGRDGSGYQPDQWRNSATFWAGGQTNLLVADNQTAKYQDAGQTERSELEARAWCSPCRR